MKSRSLWQIVVVTSSEAEEAVADLVQSALNHPASSYTDVETRESTVSVYLPTKPRWSSTRTLLANGLKRIAACGLNARPGRVSLRKLHHKDWAESWKRHFKPIVIGSQLLIRPSWSKRKPSKAQKLIELDPGLSFGTGRHPTTDFCLRGLAAGRKSDQNQSFLDIGTGSGILAIAAAKLGYKPVHAFDVDPDAVRVARENARRNNVLRAIRIQQKDLKSGRTGRTRYDMVCANLTADVLIAQHARVVKLVEHGGVLILAGLLKSDFEPVCRTYAATGLRLLASRTENEWRSGIFG